MALAICNLPSATIFCNKGAALYSFQQNVTFENVRSCLLPYAYKGALGHFPASIRFVYKASKKSILAQRRVTFIPKTFLTSSCEAASKAKQLAKRVPRKEDVLQSSFLGKRSTSHIALSSVLASHAAWASFGVYTAPASSPPKRTARNCRNLIVARNDADATFVAWLLGILAGIVVAALLALSIDVVPSGQSNFFLFVQLHIPNPQTLVG